MRTSSARITEPSVSQRSNPRAIGSRPGAIPGNWRPPEAFEDYRLLRPLGAGGMGLVYLAEDVVLARRVAIKFIGGRADAETRERFLLEARAAGRLQHPNVVSVYRVGELDERPYIVSEFARGQGLDKLALPIDWRGAMGIGIDLARGLAAAHRSGVLHCDIKPQNAVLTEDGPAKLLDFGLARLAPTRVEAEVMTSGEAPLADMVEGTPDYMAPEVWRGESPSRRSDVYALGAVLYELAAGATPFGHYPIEQLPVAVQTSDAPRLADAAPACDPRFAAIVERALARNAAERWATGDDLRAALEELAKTADAPAPPRGNPYRGLRAFDKDHRALFFGRAAEAGVVVDRLRSEPFLLVTGESGVGKSSLCRAAVLPAIEDGALGGGRGWTVLTVVPGKRPAHALATALAPLTALEADALAAAILADRHALARELARALGDAQGLLLFVDQMEELITVSDAAEREAAESALAVLAAGVPGVRLLSTLRADFLTRFAALPTLGEDLSRFLYFLRPISAERMREVVVGPARATGLSFESEEMVDALVQATAHEAGGLPLLQFALAELWEARDPEAGVIRTSALEAMGGVGGALARHADTVVVTLGSAERAEARRMLMRLVTLDDTRVRRTGVELRAESPAARAALDALVRGRLLAAYGDESDSAYELAHEVLIRSWGTLRRWLAEAAEARAVRERLAQSATEWRRLGRGAQALWSAPQIAELDRLPPEDESELERDFVLASRRARARGRWLRRGLAVGLPLALVAAWGAARHSAQREVDRRVDARVDGAQTSLRAARDAERARAATGDAAFAAFDAGHLAEGERSWALSLDARSSAQRTLREAGRQLEAGLATDPARSDVRALLGQTLFDRAALAEAAHHEAERDELVERFTLYDEGGKLEALWRAPATLRIASSRPGVRVRLERWSAETRTWQPAQDLGAAPAQVSLAPGSYVAIAGGDGLTETRAPIVLTRGADAELTLDPPAASEVPAGFVFVPEGTFVFGSADDEQTRRGWFDTVPAHPVRTDAYLIGRHEVTWGEWLTFLEGLPEAERTRRTPRGSVPVGDTGHLALDRVGGGWRLTLQPAGRAVSARAGELLDYGRAGQRGVRWERTPVTGISAEDARAYTDWLGSTGRVPRARLCTELEWERAARGADARDFPGGQTLAQGDANFDETYGKEGMGPDEVGSHPASNSPLGLSDMAGNAFEWTTSSLVPSELVVRGGSYFYDRKTARAVNRTVTTVSFREASLGMRVCATPSEAVDH